MTGLSCPTVSRRCAACSSQPEQTSETQRNLDPDVLFPLADMVSVRRDRRFIETHYPNAVFPGRNPGQVPHA